jgi:hemerythrin
MKKAIFTPALYTRNEVIDAQHKELIKRVNDLYEAIDAGDAAEAARSALDFLLGYTSYHFRSEEKLMKEKNYPKFAEHKAIHAAFVETVSDLYDDLEEMGCTDEFAARVEEAFTNWIVNHIQGTDFETIEWINNKTSGQMDNLL